MRRNPDFIRADEVTGDLPCPPLIQGPGKELHIASPSHGIRRRAA